MVKYVICPKFKPEKDDVWKNKKKKYRVLYATCMHCENMNHEDCELEFYDYGEEEKT